MVRRRKRYWLVVRKAGEGPKNGQEMERRGFGVVERWLVSSTQQHQHFPLFLASKEQNEIRLEFAKSFVQTSISRPAIDFILNEMNLTGILEKIQKSAKQIDTIGMTKDELLMGTLNSEDRLGLPGGFTQHCLKQNVSLDSLTRWAVVMGFFVLKPRHFQIFRLTYWNKDRSCTSNITRHYLCVFAVEHLLELTFDPHLFANKFVQTEDFGAIACWLEYMHNRTHLDRRLDRLDADVYLNRAQVKRVWIFGSKCGGSGFLS